jgi:5-methylcytosine-specific restriction endonuclease McrA
VPDHRDKCPYCGQESFALLVHVEEFHHLWFDRWLTYESGNARRGRKGLTGYGATLKALVRLYGHHCLACGKGNVPLTIDHVIPRADGGPDRLANYQPLCGPCNQAKGRQHTDYRLRPHPAVQ